MNTRFDLVREATPTSRAAVEETGTVFNRGTGEALPRSRGVGERRPVFFANELVAGRFQILRLLGRGGMGEVYEAHDLVLGHRVALKTLRADRVSAEHSNRSFKNEVLLARQVTHPNICRLFDLFFHSRSGNGSPKTISFVSMELLEGETLAECLRRDGPMPPSEALPIIRQLTEALAAAHRAGVLHLDFKSSNVVLVRDGDKSRAVVTDFGIALASSGRNSDVAAERTRRIGTPAYMAPEQWQNRPVSEATDIFALGVVICELVTGCNPFARIDNPAGTVDWASILSRHLQEHAARLDARWAAVIRTCLEPEPDARFAGAGEVADALQPQSHLKRRQARNRALVSAAVALAALLGAAAYPLIAPSIFGPAADGVVARALRPRQSVAVLGFRDLAGRPGDDWLSAALAEMLTTELAGGGRLRAIPGENVALALIELELPETDAFSEETLRRIRGNLGADLVVVGSYLAPPGQPEGTLRFDVRAQDTSSGEVVAAAATTGSELELVDIVSHLGSRLRQGLGAGALSSDEAGELQACQPSSAPAARLFTQGLALMRTFDAPRALAPLRAATELEPGFPLAHLALADALVYLGYEQESLKEVEIAAGLADSLPREGRLWVQARHHVATYEWDKALELYQALWTVFPDNLEYGLKLACTQTEAGRGEAALATIDRLRELPEPMCSDPRIDLREAEAARSIYDLQRQRDAAVRAADKAEASGARLVLARARLLQGRALSRLRDLEGAAAALAAARDVFEAVGDRRNSAETLVSIGWHRHYSGDHAGARQALAEAAQVLRDADHRGGLARVEGSLGSLLAEQGEVEAAAEHMEEALKIYRETVDRGGIAGTLSRMASAHWSQGHLGESRARYEEALGVYRFIGNDRGIGGSQLDLGQILLQQGDVNAAISSCQEALSLVKDKGSRLREALSLVCLGSAQRDKGNLDAAREPLRQAHAICTTLGNSYYIGRTLTQLGTVSLSAGDLVAARKEFVLAQESYRQVNASVAVASTQLLLAKVCLAEGRTAEAEQLIREALQVVERDGLESIEGWGHALLGECLARRSSPAEAIVAVKRALRLVESTEYVRMRWRTEVDSARVLVAAGAAEEAESLLLQLLSQVRHTGTRSVEVEARLVLATAELANGAPGGDRRLQRLAGEARGLGFELLATEAEEAAGATRISDRSPAASS